MYSKLTSACDEDNARAFIHQLSLNPVITLAAGEAGIVEDVHNVLGNIPESKWTAMSSDSFFKKDKVYVEGESVGIGRCIGVVQTSPERLLAWYFDVNSDCDKAKHIKNNGPNSDQYPNGEIARISFHHQITYSCQKLPFPLLPRDWLQRGIFTQIGPDEFVLVYKFVDEKTATVPPYTPSTLKEGVKRIRGELTALYRFQRLPHGCTKLTYIMKADIKGSVPMVIAEKGISGALDTVRNAYEYFQRDEEVDKLERDHFIANMDTAPDLSRDERLLMMKSLQNANYRLIGGRVEKITDVAGIESSTQRKSVEQKWKRIQVSNHPLTLPNRPHPLLTKPPRHPRPPTPRTTTSRSSASQNSRKATLLHGERPPRRSTRPPPPPSPTSGTTAATSE